MKNSNYIPALKYSWLTRFYDPVVAVTTREGLFRQMLLEQAEVVPGNKVLDLACGTGTFALLIKTRHPEVMVTGVDGDSSVLTLAKKKTEKSVFEVNFDKGMSFELPYKTGAFDIVFSSLFFHHLITRDKLRTLAEVFRVLKPGGAFHLCDWGPPTNRLSKVTFTFVRLLDGFGVTQDNVDGRIMKFMEKPGFTDIKVEGHVETFFGTLDLISAVKPKA